jgi:hypothetical protein
MGICKLLIPKDSVYVAITCWEGCNKNKKRQHSIIRVITHCQHYQN